MCIITSSYNQVFFIYILITSSYSILPSKAGGLEFAFTLSIFFFVSIIICAFHFTMLFNAVVYTSHYIT